MSRQHEKGQGALINALTHVFTFFSLQVAFVVHASDAASQPPCTPPAPPRTFVLRKYKISELKGCINILHPQDHIYLAAVVVSYVLRASVARYSVRPEGCARSRCFLIQVRPFSPDISFFQ